VWQSQDCFVTMSLVMTYNKEAKINFYFQEKENKYLYH